MPRITILAIALTLGFAGSVKAQGEALIEVYGDGVHHFNSGNFQSATELFTRVIDGGLNDPRAYYFRGIVNELQAPGSGEMDFQAGALLEATGSNVVAVGTALTRIQGSLRTKIEVARRDARVAAAAQRKMMQESQPAPVQPTPTESVPVNPPAVDAEVADTPFGDGGMRSEEIVPDAEQPVAPAADSTVDPFGDDPAPAAMPGADPAATPPAANDPFGGSSDPAPASDPFGGSSDPAPASDPFGGSGDAGSSDPFGSDPFGN